MKLIDYIKENHNGNKSAFAKANDISKQYVGEMVKSGLYYIYNDKLLMVRKELNK